MAGGPYNIPRNTKGEGRFFLIFSGKALVVTIVFALMAYIFFYFIGLMFNSKMVALIAAGVAGLIGFAITSFKIPESNNFELTRKTGGEYIYQIIIRYIKFKMQKNKIYTIFTEEKKHE